MQRSDFCNYNQVLVVVKRTITFDNTNANNWTDKWLPLGIKLNLDHAHQKFIIHS